MPQPRGQDETSWQTILLLPYHTSYYMKNYGKKQEVVVHLFVALYGKTEVDHEAP